LYNGIGKNSRKIFLMFIACTVHAGGPGSLRLLFILEVIF